MNQPYLKNYFLIAMPKLEDNTFHRAVVYIYEHNEHGAMGIVINKPMRITLGDVLKHLAIPVKDTSIGQQPVFLGGPVAQEQGFIIHPARFHSEDTPIALSDEVAVSTSKSLLQSIAQGDGPKEVIVSLGYSGWSAGQLESEIADNSWLIAPFNAKVLFHIPFEQCWHAAAATIGVDFNRLSGEAGHA
jgi:putative transcriptional regulator